MYYPASEDLFKDISKLRVELYDAVRTGNLEETQRRAAQWKMRAEKLPTSALIRTGTVTDAQRECVDEMLYGLKTLEQTMARGEKQQAKTLFSYVEKLHINCRNEFQTSE